VEGLVGSIEVGGHVFWPVMGGGAPPPDAVPVFKSLPMMRQLAEILERERPLRIVEVGIYRGGSTAMLAALAPDAQILAVELDPGPAPHLDRYLATGGSGAHLRTEFGVDQADRSRLQALVRDVFGDEPLDLVIDDASHQLAESRVTLDALLPFVRHGGAYLFEDWSWAHLRAGAWGPTLAGTTWPEGASPSVLVYELIMATGSSEGIVDAVDVRPSTALVRRGGQPLDPATFRLRDHVPGWEPYPDADQPPPSAHGSTTG
jgi:hypothetical protein